MQILDHNLNFPHPSTAPDHGLLAIGGDLSVERLLLAYQSGIFPWYSDGDPICWWSPDPRMIFDLSSDRPMRVTKSLKQSLRNRGYTVKENTSFTEVMQHCANVKRKDEDSTWINNDFINSYSKLHELGHAKSVEVFKDNQLVGGLYGIDLPNKKIFCGESMFTLATDASKIALLHLVNTLKIKGYHFIDAQLYNDHLHSLGAVEIDREIFLTYL
ncbi:Leu/Phe-tRNA-protein transferase [Flavobacteria bacterium BBFL7]|nr:Leu/Phe-tRNA-protein transferase [Flavobacteria bacterium BBFL7]